MVWRIPHPVLQVARAPLDLARRWWVSLLQIATFSPQVRMHHVNVITKLASRPWKVYTHVGEVACKKQLFLDEVFVFLRINLFQLKFVFSHFFPPQCEIKLLHKKVNFFSNPFLLIFTSCRNTCGGLFWKPHPFIATHPPFSQAKQNHMWRFTVPLTQHLLKYNRMRSWCNTCSGHNIYSYLR